MTTSKRKVFAWIPTIILSVGVIAVIATAAVLLNSGLGQPAPRPTLGQVTDLNWSSFSNEGLAYIARTREVRFDLSDAPVDAAALGLPADDVVVLAPIDNLDVVLDYSLIIMGGGDGPGGEKFVVSSIEIETAGGVITHVRAPLSEQLNFRQSLSALEAKAELFGWDTSGVPEIFDRVEAATRAGEPYSFTFGPADRIGVPVAAKAFCDPTGYCVLEYDVTPSVR
ncbi:MAG: hypothetical protein LH471_05990 [Salinibacterium sp.]|nr:hypothetical protein [Salinibacterium sp.]